MKDYDWGCNSTSQGATSYSCRCHNVDWVGSVTSCFETKGVNMSRSVIDHAYRHLRGRCLSKGHIDWPVDVLKWYQNNATDYIQDPKTIDLSEQVYHPIGVNETKYAYYSKSFNHIYAQVIRSQGYQWGYVFFWIFIIVTSAIANTVSHFIRYKGSKYNSFKWVRSHITIPNFAKSYYNKFIPIHIPSVLESVILFFFSAYSILAMTTGYSIELPNAYMNGQYWQLMDLVGYRTALCSFACIPPTFFFGIRNNPFIRICGSSIKRFMAYHKWSAYAMSINALVHSAVWTAYTIKEGDYSSWAMDAYWQWGIAGTTICFLMLFFGAAFWRELAYEVFLVFHQLFGIFFIVSMWYHCVTLGWMGWIYACIVIWVFDRLVRFLSILFNGGVKRAKITKLNDELIRVIVKQPIDNGYFPGSYYYYYFLHMKLRFYQSHPFSVMKSKRAGEEDCFSIVIKAHKGITKKLMENSNRFVDVMAEGPYGSPISLKSHEQYVFISAGVGFTPCYSYCVDLIEKNMYKSEHKLIKFIWVVKSVEYYQLFKEDMDYLVANGVEVTVIVTREKEGSDEKVLQILGKRPNAKELVFNTDISVSTSFIASGPTDFVDELRQAVAKAVKTSAVRVDFHDDSFAM